MRRALCIVLLLLFGILAGGLIALAANWSMMGGDVAHTGVSAQRAPDNPGVLWAADLMETDPALRAPTSLTTTPAMTPNDDYAIQGTSDGRLVWVRMTDGNIDPNMTRQAGTRTPFNGTPLVVQSGANYTVYASNSNGRLYYITLQSADHAVAGAWSCLPAEDAAPLGPLVGSPLPVTIGDAPNTTDCIAVGSLDRNLYLFNINATTAFNISKITRKKNEVTILTQQPHTIPDGATVTVAGVSASFNGTFNNVVAQGKKQIKHAQNGPNETVLDQGTVVYAGAPSLNAPAIWFTAGGSIESTPALGTTAAQGGNSLLGLTLPIGQLWVEVQTIADFYPGDPLVINDPVQNEFLGNITRVDTAANRVYFTNAPTQVHNPAANVRVVSTPRRPLFFGCNDGRVYAINSDEMDTHVRWIYPGQTSRSRGFTASPVVYRQANTDYVCIGDRGGQFHVLEGYFGALQGNTAPPEPLWDANIRGGFSTAALVGNTLYAGFDGTGLAMISLVNPAAPTLTYLATVPGTVRVQPIVDNRNNVYVGTQDGKVYGFSAATNTLLANWPWPAAAHMAPIIGSTVIAANNTMLAPAQDGHLICLQDGAGGALPSVYKTPLGIWPMFQADGTHHGALGPLPEAFSAPLQLGTAPLYDDTRLRWSLHTDGVVASSAAVTRNGDAIRRALLSVAIPQPPAGQAGNTIITVDDATVLHVGDILVVGDDYLGPITEITRNAGPDTIKVTYGPMNAHAVGDEVVVSLYRRDTLKDGQSNWYGNQSNAVAPNTTDGTLWYDNSPDYNPSKVTVMLTGKLKPQFKQTDGTVATNFLPPAQTNDQEMRFGFIENSGLVDPDPANANNPIYIHIYLKDTGEIGLRRFARNNDPGKQTAMVTLTPGRTLADGIEVRLLVRANGNNTATAYAQYRVANAAGVFTGNYTTIGTFYTLPPSNTGVPPGDQETALPLKIYPFFRGYDFSAPQPGYATAVDQIMVYIAQDPIDLTQPVIGPGTRYFEVEHGERFLDGDWVQITHPDNVTTELIPIERVWGDRLYIHSNYTVKNKYPVGSKLWVGFPGAWAVYVGSEDGTLRAIDPNGEYVSASDAAYQYIDDTTRKVLWKNTVTGYLGSVHGAPVVDVEHARIYVASLNGRIFAFSQNGQFLWAYPALGRPSLGPIDASPVLDEDGNIYFTVQAGKKYYAGGVPDYEGGRVYKVTPDGLAAGVFPPLSTDPMAVIQGGLALYYVTPNTPATLRVVVGGRDGKLYSLDRNLGKKWEYATSAAITASPVVDEDGTIYLGNKDGKVYAIYEDGAGIPQSRWFDAGPTPIQYTADGAITTAAAVTYGYDAATNTPYHVVFVGDQAGMLHAIVGTTTADQAANSRKIALQDPGYPASQPEPACGPLTLDAGGKVLVGTANGSVFCVALTASDALAIRWRWNTVVDGKMPVALPMRTAPALWMGDVVIAGNDDGNIYAIGPKGTDWTPGDPDQSVDRPAGPWPVFHRDSRRQGSVNLLSAEDPGAQQPTLRWWQQHQQRLASSPAIVRMPDGTMRVYQADQTGVLHAYEASTGNELWNIALPGCGPVRATPAVHDDGTVAVAALDGRVYLVNADGTLAWSTLDNTAADALLGNATASPVMAMKVVNGVREGAVYVATADSLHTAGTYTFTDEIDANQATTRLTDGDDATAVTGKFNMTITYAPGKAIAVTRVRVRTASTGGLWYQHDGNWFLYSSKVDTTLSTFTAELSREVTGVRWVCTSNADVAVQAFEVYSEGGVDLATGAGVTYYVNDGTTTTTDPDGLPDFVGKQIDAVLPSAMYVQKIIITTRSDGKLYLLDQKLTPSANPWKAFLTRESDEKYEIPIKRVVRGFRWKCPSTDPAVFSTLKQFEIYTTDLNNGGGRVYALDVTNGTIKAQYPPAGQPALPPIVSSPAASAATPPANAADIVVVATTGGQVIGLREPNLAKLWEKQLTQSVTASPVLVERFASMHDVLVADTDGGVHFLQGDSGEYPSNIWPLHVTGPVSNAFLLSHARSKPSTVRVSVNASGNQGNDLSTSAAISANGRYVAFASDASNLVTGDTNAVRDIFLRDRLTGVVTRISVDSGGTQANGPSDDPVVSEDGHYIAFTSTATNLVAGVNNGRQQVYIYDRVTGQVTCASVDDAGTQGGDDSLHPALSANGNLVAFDSAATNLVLGDVNGRRDIFVRDRAAGTTTRVSMNTGNTDGGNGNSVNPALSADGRLVVFESLASDLLAPGTDNNGMRDIYLRDRQTGVTTRISLTYQAMEAETDCTGPAISADGRYVAFESMSAIMVADDTNGTQDVFVRDLSANTVSRVSLGSMSGQADGASFAPSLSADGRLVLFASDATNLVNGDGNGRRDLFLRDRKLGTTIRVSVGNTGAQGNNNANAAAALSGSGRFVAFSSLATNLVSDDTSAAEDVFVRDLGAPGHAYLFADRGEVYRFDDLTAGSFAQIQQLPTGVKSSPVMDTTGRIYVGSDAGLVFCLDADGNILWAYRPDRSNIFTSLYEKANPDDYWLKVASLADFSVGDPVQITRPDGSWPEDLGKILSISTSTAVRTTLRGVTADATNAANSPVLQFVALPAGIAVDQVAYLSGDTTGTVAAKYRVLSLDPGNNQVTLYTSVADQHDAPVTWTFTKTMTAGQTVLPVAGTGGINTGENVYITPATYAQSWAIPQPTRLLGAVQAVDTINNTITLDRGIDLIDLDGDGVADDPYPVGSMITVGIPYDQVRVSKAPTQRREIGDLLHVTKALSLPIRTSPAIGPSNIVYVGADDGILYAIGPLGPAGYPAELPEIRVLDTSATWPTFHHDNQRTGYANRPGPITEDLRWYRNTSSTLESSPALGFSDDSAPMGVLYTGSCDEPTVNNYTQMRGSMMAWNASSGYLRWRQDDDGEMGRIFSSPAVATVSRRDPYERELKDELIVFGTVDTAQFLRSQVMQARYVDNQGNEVDDNGVLAGDKVVALQVDNAQGYEIGMQVYLTNSDTDNDPLTFIMPNLEVYGIISQIDAGGWLRLQTQHVVQYDRDFNLANMAVILHSQSSQQGHVYALDRAGNIRWKYPADNAAASERIGAVRSSPVISMQAVTADSDDYKDCRIYFGTVNGDIYALDMNGRMVWHYVVPRADASEARMEISSSPALLDAAGSRLFVGVSLPEKNTGYVLALNTKPDMETDQRKVWMTSLPGPVTASPMVTTLMEGPLTYQRVYVGVDNTNGGTGGFYCLDPDDGTVKISRTGVPVDYAVPAGAQRTLGPITSTAAAIPDANTVSYTIGTINGADVTLNKTDGLMAGMRVRLFGVTEVEDRKIVGVNNGTDITLDAAPAAGVAYKTLRTNEQCILVGSMDGRLYAFTEKLVPIWEFKTGVGISTSPAISTETGLIASGVRSYTAYFGSNNHFLYALTFYGDTRLVRWVKDMRDRVYASPVVGMLTAENAGRAVVYQVSRDRYIYAFGDRVNYDGDDMDVNGPTDEYVPDEDSENRVPSTIEAEKAVENYGADDPRTVAPNDDNQEWWRFVVTVKNTGRGLVDQVKIYDTLPVSLVDPGTPPFCKETYVYPAGFMGQGLNDLSTIAESFTDAGGNAPLKPVTYTVQIDNDAAVPNTFKWSKDNGASWEQTNVAITGGVQVLDDGVNKVAIRFGAPDGHVKDDNWVFLADRYDVTVQGGGADPWEIVWTDRSPITGLPGTGFALMPELKELTQPRHEYTRSFIFYVRVKPDDPTRTYDVLGTRLRATTNPSVMMNGAPVDGKNRANLRMGDTLYLQFYKHPLPREQGGEIAQNQLYLEGVTYEGSTPRPLEVHKETPVQTDWSNVFTVRMYYNGYRDDTPANWGKLAGAGPVGSGMPPTYSPLTSLTRVFSAWNQTHPDTGDPLIFEVPMTVRANGQPEAAGRRMITYPSANADDGWGTSGVQVPLYPRVQRFDRLGQPGEVVNSTVTPYAWRVTIQQGKAQLNQRVVWGPEIPVLERVEVAKITGGGTTNTFTVDDVSRVRIGRTVLIDNPTANDEEAVVTGVTVGPPDRIVLDRNVQAEANALVRDEWGPDVVIRNPVTVAADGAAPSTLTLGAATVPQHIATGPVVTVSNNSNWGGVPPTFPQYHFMAQPVDLRLPNGSMFDWNSQVTGTAGYGFGMPPDAGTLWDGFRYDPYREHNVTFDDNALDMPGGYALRAGQKLLMHFTRPVPSHQTGGNYQTRAERLTYVDANNNGAWDPGERLFYDLNGDGAYQQGNEPILDDRNNDGAWGSSERLFFDQNNDGIYQQGELCLALGIWDLRVFMDMNGDQVWNAGEPYYTLNPASGGANIDAEDLPFTMMGTQMGISQVVDLRLPNTVLDLGRRALGSPERMATDAPSLVNKGNTILGGGPGLTLLNAYSSLVTTDGAGGYFIRKVPDQLYRAGTAGVKFNPAGSITLRKINEYQPFGFRQFFPSNWALLKSPADDDRDFSRPFSLQTMVTNRQPSGPYLGQVQITSGNGTISGTDTSIAGLRVGETCLSQVVPGHSTPPIFDYSRSISPFQNDEWANYLTGNESWPTAAVLTTMHVDPTNPDENDDLGVWVSSNTPVTPVAGARPLDPAMLVPTNATDTNIWFRRAKHLHAGLLNDVANGAAQVVIDPAIARQVRAGASPIADLLVLRVKDRAGQPAPFTVCYLQAVTADKSTGIVQVKPLIPAPQDTYTEQNGVPGYQPGEPFIDANGNGQYDAAAFWDKQSTSVEIISHPWVPVVSTAGMDALRQDMSDPGVPADAGPRPIQCSTPSVALDSAGNPWLTWSVYAVRRFTRLDQNNNPVRVDYIPVSCLAYKKYNPKSPFADTGDNTVYWITPPDMPSRTNEAVPLWQRQRPVMLPQVNGLDTLVLYEGGKEGARQLYNAEAGANLPPKVLCAVTADAAGTSEVSVSKTGPLVNGMVVRIDNPSGNDVYARVKEIRNATTVVFTQAVTVSAGWQVLSTNILAQTMIGGTTTSATVTVDSTEMCARGMTVIIDNPVQPDVVARIERVLGPTMLQLSQAATFEVSGGNRALLKAYWATDEPLAPINWAFTDAARPQVWADSVNGNAELPAKNVNMIFQGKPGSGNTDLYYARAEVNTTDPARPLMVLRPLSMPEAKMADPGRNTVTEDLTPTTAGNVVFTGGKYLAWDLYLNTTGAGQAGLTLVVKTSAGDKQLTLLNWEDLTGPTTNVAREIPDTQREYILAYDLDEDPNNNSTKPMRLALDPYRGVVRVLKMPVDITITGMQIIGMPRVQRLTKHLAPDVNPVVSIERWRSYEQQPDMTIQREYGANGTLKTYPRVWLFWTRQHDDGLGTRAYYRTLRMYNTGSDAAPVITRLVDEIRGSMPGESPANTWNVDMPDRMLPMEVLAPDGSINVTRMSASVLSPEAGLWVLSTNSRDVWPQYPLPLPLQPTQHDLFLQVINVPVPDN